LLESILGEVPTIIIEHRSLFDLKDDVPIEPYRQRFGRASIRREGIDVTVVAIGYNVHTILNFAKKIDDHNISIEVIDPITLSPIDEQTIIESVKKTGKLIVVDHGWRSFGAAAEIIAFVSESCHAELKCAPSRITFPDSHTPMSSSLEKEFYLDEESLASEIKKKFNG